MKLYCVEGLGIKETKDIGVTKDILSLDGGGGEGGTSFKSSNLSMKEGSLFVLFVCHIKIFQTAAPLATLWSHLESPQCVGVHWVSFIMFQYMVEKVLNIEQNLNKKSLKPKQKFVGEFGCSLGIFRNAPLMSRI